MVIFEHVPMGGEIYQEAKELIQMHFEEVATAEKLDVDFLSYMALNTAVFLARSEGVLVGYSIYLLFENHQDQHTRCAQQDVVFLHKDYRRGFTGYKFLKYQEDELKTMGVKRIHQSTKKRLDLGALFRRLGYTKTDVIYTKEL